MKLKIATWNINSIRLRENLVLEFLTRESPDVLCLQECKSPVEFIPTEGFRSIGYPLMLARGQKGYNGVVILSRLPIEPVEHRNFCGKGDARHVAGRLSNGITIHNVYVPSGGDVPDPKVNDKFAHKLQFLDEMQEWFESRPPVKSILVGDLNIAPLEDDVWSHRALLKVVSHTPIEVERLESVQNAGNWSDITRLHNPSGKLYSWWSYRARDWSASDRGRRLDHIWATEELAGCSLSSSIQRQVRGWEKPSDHVPVVATFEIN
ncbi:MAG: exodeoxyribonuclease III [Rhodobacteraceae bacterium]|nr:exodeoxyribonuclease III [Paracoccaceae bacterium]MCY4141621.1 exodeoxyribonuclease III [Paracoccaceae bacterium]